MRRERVVLERWIYENSVNSNTLVELGAGFFTQLQYVHESVKNKIGIEIWQPYIDNAVYHDCIKIQGNILDYKELLKEYDVDTVLLCDILEHFNMADGYKLIESLKKDFNKILLMLPYGIHEQYDDSTGYGADKYQKHRSFWFEEDIEKLNFTKNIIDFKFQGNPEHHCYFGVWVR